MIAAALSFIKQAGTWLLSHTTTNENTAFIRSNQQVSAHGYFAGRVFIERVSGAWSATTIKGIGAISRNGLTLCMSAWDASQGGHLLLYTRPNLATSFLTVTPVTVQLDLDPPIAGGIAMNSDGTRIVSASVNGAGLRVSTAIFNGSTWVANTFDSSAESASWYIISLNPSGTRLVIGAGTICRNFTYSGNPVTPWVAQTSVGNQVLSGYWVNDDNFLCVTSGNVVTLLTKGSGDALVEGVARDRAALGINTFTALRLVGCTTSQLLLSALAPSGDTVLLVFTGAYSTGSWVLSGIEDVRQNNAIILVSQSSYDCKQVVVTTQQNSPFLAYLLER